MLSIKTTTASVIYHICVAVSRLSTVNAIHTLSQLATPTAYESLTVTRTSQILSVAVESHEAVDEISAYIDQRRAVHLRQILIYFVKRFYRFVCSLPTVQTVHVC